MIGARRGGVVAVIGSDDEKVGAAQGAEHICKSCVEPFQVAGVSLDIVPVAKLGVEVYQVYEDEPLCVGTHDVKQMIDAFTVTTAVQSTSDPPGGKEVPHLSNRDNGYVAYRQQVEQRVARRGQCVVMPVGRSLKGAGLSHEWSRDDASNAPGSDDLECDLAHPVQLGE